MGWARNRLTFILISLILGGIPLTRCMVVAPDVGGR
ncbi:hypothetical protein A8U91_01577 [Halomonas elongata]|uniref:Uncharacterized protein n=1 Tax=Halomonas elongata TaxID=2746 RepID=A0A1B8P4M5_HALEL|nr:hypothetical protein A8U91_01577 [Halomonas elongata]